MISLCRLRAHVVAEAAVVCVRGLLLLLLSPTTASAPPLAVTKSPSTIALYVNGKLMISTDNLLPIAWGAWGWGGGVGGHEKC